MASGEALKSIKVSKQDFDERWNRISLGLAKREALVKSWTASSSRAQEPQKTEAELDAEDAILFRNEPAHLGVGASIPSYFLVSEAERNNKSLRAKFFPPRGLKASKARDAEEKASSAKRGLKEDSSDEEEGRSGLGKAKKQKTLGTTTSIQHTEKASDTVKKAKERDNGWGRVKVVNAASVQQVKGVGDPLLVEKENRSELSGAKKQRPQANAAPIQQTQNDSDSDSDASPIEPPKVTKVKNGEIQANTKSSHHSKKVYSSEKKDGTLAAKYSKLKEGKMANTKLRATSAQQFDKVIDSVKQEKSKKDSLSVDSKSETIIPKASLSSCGLEVIRGGGELNSGDLNTALSTNSFVNSDHDSGPKAQDEGDAQAGIVVNLEVPNNLPSINPVERKRIKKREAKKRAKERKKAAKAAALASQTKT